MSFIDQVKKTTSTVGNVIKKTYGPLAALELPSNTSGVYRYPLDVGSSKTYPHTVEFQTWVPDPIALSETAPFAATASAVEKIGGATLESLNNAAFGLPGKIGGAVKGIVGGAETWFQKKTGINLFDFDPTPSKASNTGVFNPSGGPVVNRNQQFNSRLFDFTRRATKSDMIVMYLPNAQWQDTVKSQFEGKSMTEALGAAGLGAEVVSSLTEGFKAGDGGIINKTMNSITTAGTSPAAAEIALKTAGGLVGGNGDTLAQAGLAAMGYAVNPQMEMLYGGTDFREFSFQFIMTPRTREEAESIRNILYMFKYHASPAFTNNYGRFIVPPSYFDISFKFNGADNDKLPKISTCALRDVTIQYNNGLEQWATYEDGMPIQVELTLTFVELEMMHKELRKQGY